MARRPERLRAAGPAGLLQIPLMWTSFAFSTAGKIASSMARNLSSAPSARRNDPPLRWTTEHQVALELEAVTLRDFSAGRPADGATLICTPLAFHRATIADFAPGHSLVAALREAGIGNVFVIDWLPATTEMRYKSLDSYFSDLNVLVDSLPQPVDIVGLCQGGWMALAYAARFPHKVRKLVLAGAPVDVETATSSLSALASRVPADMFEHFVELGNGTISGARVLDILAPAGIDEAYMLHTLQIPRGTPPQCTAALREAFDIWFWTTIDIPGRYYLDVVSRIFKQNQLATNRLEVLGRMAVLSRVEAPLLLLAAEHDEFVAPEQIFAAERLTRPPAGAVRKITVPGNHLGLFLGGNTIRKTWPKIARWLAAAPA
ncbi:alpha/beta fold hydrolase [Pseudochelatococcus sp. B33]